MHTLSPSSGLRGINTGTLILCLAASGCATVAPPVPQDIASSAAAFDVRSAGRMNQLFGDGYFEVGSYRITGIHHGIVRGNELSIGQRSQTSFSGRFKFLIAGPRSTWTAHCDRQAQSTVIALHRVDVQSSKKRLYCELNSGEQHATVELRDQSEGLYGAVTIGSNSFDLRQYADGQVNTRTAYVPDAQGVRIDHRGQNVAALALAHPGTFWLNRKLAPEQQDALAGVLAAVLISARRY